MRRVVAAAAACAAVLAGLPRTGAAQQGSVQVGAALHAAQGDPLRLGGQEPVEPEITVSWLRPQTRLGTFQLELRGITRDTRPHLGRVSASFRDFTYRGVTYSVEAGDSFFSPARGDYQLRNLFTPSVNFAGAAVKASAPATTVSVMAGRATASRSYFGSDPETLGQTLVIGRASHRLSDRLELSSRLSRIRTRDLKEFTFTVAASDQAGMGARFVLTPAVHLVGDASVVHYRRRDSAAHETDGSALVGASLLLGRGWVQLSAARFSPGELPVLSQPLADRQTLYAAGEYDVIPRLRVFGGWEAFTANLSGHTGPGPSPGDGTRAFAGLRVPIGGRSSASVRVEDGARRSRLLAGLTRVSDTGVVSGELQSTLGSLSAFGRFARRENVESDRADGSFTQQEGAGLVFANLTRDLQLFGSMTGVRNERRSGGGHTYWQFGGGLQTRVTTRGLWVRGEALASRNVDLLNDRTVPQQTFSFGLNGRIAEHTVLAVNLHADRVLPPAGSGPDSWVTRSSLRVTRTFPTAGTRAATGIRADMARHSGTGSIAGLVFSDWNANGVRDAGEEALENIPIRLAELGHASTSLAGEFAFVNVPIGIQQVGIDMMSLPVDFDPPAASSVQLELRRGETFRVAFGLVPMGSIEGRVQRDVNANGAIDEGDVPIDGAVVVLDGGARSEPMRRGRFRFDAVRSGEHRVTLLPESLPERAAILGDATVTVAIGRGALASTTAFLVAFESRPEVRRVFAPEPAPGRTPPAAASPSRPRPAPAAGRASPPAKGASEARRPPAAVAAAPTAAPGRFAVQVAALNDPTRAADLVAELRSAGFTAYLVDPSASDPDAPYKIRVGAFETRDEADRTAQVLEQSRRQKVWVVRELGGQTRGQTPWTRRRTGRR